MTKRTRRAVFYALLALFPVLGAGIVLYAQGWRLDLATWRAAKVGAILVRPYPADASITLDGKPVANQASFLSESTVISGLFPGNHDLMLAAPGYRNWSEEAAVLPSLVTEFKHAVLVPSAPASITTSSVEQFAVGSAGAPLIQTTAGAIMLAGTTTTVARGAIVSASADLQTFIYRTAAGMYEWRNVAAGTSANLSAALARGGADVRSLITLAVDRSDATLFVALSSNRLWTFDAARGTTALIDRAPTGAAFGAPLASSPALLAWSQFRANAGVSAIVLYNRSAKTLAGSSSTVPARTLELQWINPSLLGVLQSDGLLYAYDINAGQFKKIADDVKQFAAAPDGSAVATLEHRSFEVIPFADTQTYHRFNLPDVASASEVIWYEDADHLFVVYPDSVSFLDLADAGLQNLVSIAKGTRPLYSPDKNVLYLINAAQKLEQFDFPS